MAKSNKNRFVKSKSGSSIAALIVVLLIIVAVGSFWLFAPSKKSAPPTVKHVLPSVQTPASTSPFKNATAVQPPAGKKPAPVEQDRYPESAAPLEENQVKRADSDGTARLAIVIDDMGSSMSEARSLAAIGVPLTFSIIPGLQKSREVAAFAASGGIETMIHMPMQSKGWPARRLESNGLLVSMEDGELRERVAGYMRDLPGAVGANNHTGSEFTEHADKMRSVLETLDGKGLFFVDSVTTPQSAGIRLARELGMKNARRNVFLDNEQVRGYILGQLGQAVRMAKKNGSAIAICHPHPATIAALASALPGLTGQGVTLVPASKLVR